MEIHELLEEARAALANGDAILAADAATSAIARDPADLDARYLLALALVRAGARQRARVALDDLTAALSSKTDVTPALREDAAALEGRLAKELALCAHGSERRVLAARAADQYEAVADRYGGYFSCINAATLWLVAGDTERAQRLAERALRLTDASGTGDGVVDAYWRAATRAEASLVLGDAEAAASSLEQAAVLGAADVAARAVTGRQLRLLCDTTGIDSTVLDALALPSVLHYCGHRSTIDETAAGGFAPDEEPRVAAEVRSFLQARSFDSAYGALACGADIIIAEVLLDEGVAVHVVLPFEPDQFEATSVRSGGDRWAARFRACLARASSVVVTYDSAFADDPTLFGYAAKVAMGHALHRAAHLGVGAEQLAVWDGEVGDSNAGTGHDVAAWRAAGRPTHVIQVVHRRAPSGALDSAARRRIASMLFTDVKGFSRLRDEHQQAFVDHVLGPSAAALDAFGDLVEYRNTWGDAILAVCSDVATTAAAALALQDVMSTLDTCALGLPDDLGLRVGAHVGPLISLDDPVRCVPAFWGRELTRAARIEPGTPEGEVYVTDAFAALCVLECGQRFVCEYVGRVTTAKSFETIPMYRLRRA